MWRRDFTPQSPSQGVWNQKVILFRGWPLPLHTILVNPQNLQGLINILTVSKTGKVYSIFRTSYIVNLTAKASQTRIELLCLRFSVTN